MSDELNIRPATLADAEAIAEIWRQGWYEVHLETVPRELVEARTPESFDTRARKRVPDTVVATVHGEVAGFVMIHDDELDQVYVSAKHRGAGVAAAVITAAEDRVRSDGHRRAWLAVVADNPRARRFYERQGWVDDGDFDNPAWTPDGPVAVPTRRYVKEL
ncbi:GNAT family N-acetyltransferase [Stackebrandtia nassauensis]|uniref:GCN5-related N-acetyltransferase n=1 Tax=Stackebrandtia nassauensis (strain DSM 44728 / CIP 108903 / NRRL B-16338 / NBRC 102104 / LLR-40K-21) TaxID=446470 RepID=D3Q2I2_STANL|nr:GNAT family N-acetyltransferase [Stackebrandtia nassauensis]ADD43915.1 GCN5-related N-acetyltransferase [Stackebrandtia nassauensis DSM 44728]